MFSRNMDLPKKQPKRFRRKAVRKSGPPQRKLGRPTKLDQIDTDKLIAEIARGVPVSIACAAAGIDTKTFYNWLDGRPEFARALAIEKQQVIEEAISGIRTGSKDNEWRGHAWFLERVYKDHFAAPVPGVAFTQNNVMIGELDEARRILDAAKALPYRSGEIAEKHGQEL